MNFKKEFEKYKKNYKKKFIKWFKANKSDLGIYFLTVVLQGFIINFIMWALFSWKFSVWTWIAWGLLYSFLRSDFIDWFREVMAAIK